MNVLRASILLMIVYYDDFVYLLVVVGAKESEFQILMSWF